MRLAIGDTNARATGGTSRLSDTERTSTWTPLPICRYTQYEFNRHRNPRSPPPVSRIDVATLRPVASPGP
jgi:hypothetical protein